MQFAGKPLFENISAKFGDGNRYGLIGANGCGKSTFMKILDGSLMPTSGNVSAAPNERVGTLSQNQFDFEKQIVGENIIFQSHTNQTRINFLLRVYLILKFFGFFETKSHT